MVGEYDVMSMIVSQRVKNVSLNACLHLHANSDPVRIKVGGIKQKLMAVPTQMHYSCMSESLY